MQADGDDELDRIGARGARVGAQFATWIAAATLVVAFLPLTTMAFVALGVTRAAGGLLIGLAAAIFVGRGAGRWLLLRQARAAVALRRTDGVLFAAAIVTVAMVAGLLGCTLLLQWLPPRVAIGPGGLVVLTGGMASGCALGAYGLASPLGVAFARTANDELLRRQRLAMARTALGRDAHAARARNWAPSPSRVETAITSAAGSAGGRAGRGSRRA